LRDSYARELLRRKKEKSGSGAPRGRKQYIYFDQLRFLETVVKTTKPSAEVGEDVQSIEQMGERSGAEEINALAGTQRSRSRSKKESSEEEKLFAVLKQKLLKGSTKEPEANDEDTLFMLSLVPELKKVPEAMKLDIKSDLLNVFKRARLQQHATSSFARVPSQAHSLFQSTSRPPI
jgi:hypothetical protein